MLTITLGASDDGEALCVFAVKRFRQRYVEALARGRLPRRATARPPRASASASVRSSSRTPFRASAKVILTTAPLPSPISWPDLSLTLMVFFATRYLLILRGALTLQSFSR